jgi:PAS domain S-box-containing protein
LATGTERTALTEADHALSSRLLAAIVESSDDAIISKSLDGIIRTWNTGAERIFGYTAEQAIGRNIALIIPPERLEIEESRIISRLKAGQRIDHFETERVDQKGRIVRVSLTISPIRDESGNVIGASKIARDITRQREIEERERLLLREAAEANAKFRAFFEQGSQFAAILERDGIVVEVNRQSGHTDGYPRERIIGRAFWDGPWWAGSPDRAERVREAVLRAGDGHAFRDEMPYHNAKGVERVADLNVVPVIDRAGEVRFIAVTGGDITDRKHAESERQRLEEGLRELAGNLSQANRRMNVFLATLAHELRNPLAPLASTLEILRRPGASAVPLEQSVDTMHRQLHQVVRLVDDLLDLSRITHDRLELRMENVELAPMLHEAVAACMPVAQARNHRVDVSLPPAPVHLYADATRLTQVFSNLLHNGCKYTPRGGSIRVTAERHDAQVLVVFADNGIGIPASKLHGIFEMFEQVESSIEHSQGGLGIGLTLVQRLVQMHDGTVEAHSAGIGQGSRFEVRLPALADAPRAPVDAPDAGEQQLEPRRILVVDDNRDAATSLSILLELSGHEVRTAHDGPEGLELAEHYRPGLVLLDIGLPTLSGYEVCRRLRQRSWGREPVVIALTGWGQDADRRKSVEAGFDGHLVKPVNYATLVDLARRLLAERETA